MKKTSLILVAGLSCLVLVGCGTKSAPTPTLDTGMLFSGEQALTGTQSGDIFSGQHTNTREEVTGETTTGSLIITGKSATTTTTGTITTDVANLIKTRATQPKDPNKLTEDDIDLMDKVIQKVESITK